MLWQQRRKYCEHSANRLLTKSYLQQPQNNKSQQERFTQVAVGVISDMVPKKKMSCICFNPQLVGTREENVLYRVVISMEL